MVSSWLGYTNWWVAFFGWVAFCGAVEPLNARGKVLPMLYFIQRKLLTFIHTLFTAFFLLVPLTATASDLLGHRAQSSVSVGHLDR